MNYFKSNGLLRSLVSQLWALERSWGWEEFCHWCSFKLSACGGARQQRLTLDSSLVVSLLWLHQAHCFYSATQSFSGSDALEGQTKMVKNLPAVQETRVWSLGQEDPLEKGLATHSSILAWRIPWTEEPGGLQSIGPQGVGHSWATNTFTHFHFSLSLRNASLHPSYLKGL